MHRRAADGSGEIKVFGCLLLTWMAAVVLSGCSMKRAAVNLAGSMFSGGGQTYSSDDDPQFIRESLPFGIKASEGLLEEAPDHRGLLLMVAKGYAIYAYLLQDEAERVEAADLSKARELRARARKFYLRSRDHGLKGLGILPSSPELLQQTARRIPLATKEEVAFLYWAAVSWAGALSAAKDDLKLISELPVSGMMAERVLQLDEAYEQGAAHEFLISYEGARPGGSSAKARYHYQRALDLSAGRRASVHLALAESVAVHEQNVMEFRALLKATMAVDPDRHPELRLVNTIARRRAEWLLKRLSEMFLDSGEKEESQ